MCALQSLALRGDGWIPPIVKAVASEGKGIGDLAQAIGDYETYLVKENLLLKRNVHHWQERLVEMLRDSLLNVARGQISDLQGYAAEVAEHKRDPYTLVEDIISKLVKN